jgi:acyl dehydratase
MPDPVAPYRLFAYNSARQSENKMHDDQVARQFGFGGGLVPGVDVYAYMAHPAVARWGRRFLDEGALAARFLQPVYDGELATVSTREANGGLDIEVTCRDVLCASGHARLGAVPAPSLADFAAVAAVDARAPATEATLAPERWLGIRPLRVTAPFAVQYLQDVRETDPIYAAEGLCHPGLLPRLFNWALTHNVVLGPWIHVGSQLQHFAAVRIGDELSVRAKILANYERKGHHFVELDGVIVADAQRPIARVAHTAIWRPRAAPASRDC